MSKHLLAGSERKPLAGAILAGPADPAERLEVTLLLRRNDLAGLQDRVNRLHKGDYSVAPISREDFLKNHGAREDDIAAVTKFADLNDVSVVSVNRARRSIVLSGAVKDFEAAFGVKLKRYEHPGGAYRGREGALLLPDGLEKVVEAVLGLDNRPQARPHFRPLAAKPQDAAPPASYSPVDVANFYGFPAATGQGQTIAIVEFGGGSRSADLSEYFQSLNLAVAPKVVSVSVDHGRNHATGNADDDGEVMLDIEVAGAIAPGATIAVYYAPNTDAGFLDAVTTAIHDTTYKPSVLSISWGGSESNWTAQAMDAMDAAFQDAAVLGITVLVASGDGGSTDGAADGANHVDFPASSPHVLACGGTRLVAENGAISAETVWNDLPSNGATGGGISTYFTLPVWQNGLSATLVASGAEKLTMRGSPDVAGDADPETGYLVRVDGQNMPIGGTSAVAPLWAALIARINELRANLSLPSIGFLNPILYANQTALNDIDEGNNGAFAATEGWDACTGLGSPDGRVLTPVLVKNTSSPDASSATDDAFIAKSNAFLNKGKALQKKGEELIAKGQSFIDKGHALLPSRHLKPLGNGTNQASGDAQLPSRHDEKPGKGSKQLSTKAVLPSRHDETLGEPAK